MFDDAGRVINGKRDARVHGLRASYAPDFGSVCIGAGTERLDFSLREPAKLEAWLSAYFAMAVQLRRDREHGFPDDLQAPGPTVISTSTLQTVADWFGLDEDDTRRRFRANLEIDGVAAFWEDRLYGEAGTVVPVDIGPATLLGTNPCQRCVVPSRDPDDGAVIAAFSKRFAAQREATLPAWAARGRFDHYYRLAVNTAVGPEVAGRTIRRGDPIALRATTLAR